MSISCYQINFENFDLESLQNIFRKYNGIMRPTLMTLGILRKHENNHKWGHLETDFFYLEMVRDGFVNKQNCRYGIDTDPHQKRKEHI